MKCFEIPEFIDPSIIYSDKSHSMGRKEVTDYDRSGRKELIPSQIYSTGKASYPMGGFPNR